QLFEPDFAHGPGVVPVVVAGARGERAGVARLVAHAVDGELASLSLRYEHGVGRADAGVATALEREREELGRTTAAVGTAHLLAADAGARDAPVGAREVGALTVGRGGEQRAVGAHHVGHAVPAGRVAHFDLHGAAPGPRSARAHAK